MRNGAGWRLICALVAVALVAGAGAVGARQAVELVPVATGLRPTVLVTHAGDGSGRLFLLERRGRILIHDGAKLLDRAFLDLQKKVGCCAGETGLMGLAFHPDYETNGLFFVTYSDRNNDSIVSRFSVSAANPDRADPSSERVLLEIPQPHVNHNVGTLAFGPDGFLYVGTGDGGGAGDPFENSQDLGSLLGKILRLDVDTGASYSIPSGNPFVATPGARPEIWAYGLRNPWRFSFDRKRGDLFIGDVGQDAFEEVDRERRGSPGGRNYGWPIMEGGACFDPPEGCDRAGLTLPLLDYEHDHAHEGEEAGCAAVIGGHRYRGPAVPTLPRFYLFGDLCGGQLFGARPDARGVWRATELLRTGLFIFSFGEDEAGNVYVVDRAGVYRLVGHHTFADDFESGNTRRWTRRPGSPRVVSPGLGGTARALEVRVDGTPARRALVSGHPRKLSSFRIDFVLAVDGVQLGGAAVEILRLAGPEAHVFLTLEQDGGGYFVGLFARGAGEEWRSFGRVQVPAGREVRLALDWLQASSPEAADGSLELLRDGAVRRRARDLANGSLTVDTVFVGLPSGSVGAVGGSFRIDELTTSP